MHRPGCPSCRLNRRASEVADTAFTFVAIFLMALSSAQLWLLWLARKAFPRTDECREHRESLRKT
jgi:hypothetical protein